MVLFSIIQLLFQIAIHLKATSFPFNGKNRYFLGSMERIPYTLSIVNHRVATDGKTDRVFYDIRVQGQQQDEWLVSHTYGEFSWIHEQVRRFSGTQLFCYLLELELSSFPSNSNFFKNRSEMS